MFKASPQSLEICCILDSRLSDRNSTKSLNILVTSSCVCSNSNRRLLSNSNACFCWWSICRMNNHDGRSPYAPLRPRSLSRCLACLAASCSSRRAWDSASNLSTRVLLSSGVSGGGGSAGAGAAGAAGASLGCVIRKLTIPSSTLKISLCSFRNPLIVIRVFCLHSLVQIIHCPLSQVPF